MLMNEILLRWIPEHISRELTVFGTVLSFLVIFLGVSAWNTPQQLTKLSPHLVDRVSKIISRRALGWGYLLNGPTIIQHGFEKV